MGLTATTLLVAAGTLGGGEPPRVHAVAFVNDPLSHGAVGDGLLSLNEAILLHNGTLPLAALSPAELAQLSLIPGTGATTDVTWIDIDANNTPLITIQQDLATILDTPFGLLIKGFGGRPILDFSTPGLTRGMLAPANSLALQDLEFVGGLYGVDVVQTDASGQAGLTLQNVHFVQQATFGVRVRATTANGVGRMIVEDCEFAGCPQAIVHDETGTGRTTIVEIHGLHVRGGLVGFDAALGNGGSTRFTFDQVDIEASTLGLRITRPANADRPALIEGDYVRVRAADAADFACHATAWTWAVLRGWDVQAGPGGDALRLGAPGNALFGEVGELTAVGDVTIAAGGASQPLALTNHRCAQGNVILATSPAQAFSLTECRFDNCAVATAGSAPIVATGCMFVGGSLVGTVAAPLQLTACFAPTPGQHVLATAPLPAAQLGAMSITPENVLVGGTVTFQADLPAGLLGLFVLGLTPDAPLLTGPFRVYVDPVQNVLWPGAFTLQQNTVWSIPSTAQFLGADLTVQMVVLPTAGTQAPWLQMTPGRRFVLR